MANDSVTAGGSGRFPTTHWTMLDVVRGPMTPQRREVLNCLILRYWKPVYVYICRRGFQNEAADLTQDFFTHWLEKELFGRADRALGRFRTYLLTCLNNFFADAGRRKQRQRPAEGIVSIQQLASDERMRVEPAETETPEAVFFRVWVAELLSRTWRTLEQEFAAAGQQTHCELFRRRVLDPILTGCEPPPMGALAKELDLPPKRACNYLVTARRAFQRLLRQEILIYASSNDEVASEIQELFRFAAGP